MSPNTLTPLPNNEIQRIKELENRLRNFSAENDRLKRIVAEKNYRLLLWRRLKI